MASPPYQHYLNLELLKEEGYPILGPHLVWDNSQKFLIKQLEAIKFASDWHQRSTKPGIRRFKKEFVQRSFDTDPAHYLLHLNGTSEQQEVYKKAISAFKVRHGKLITSRNYLLQFYQRVCTTAVYVVF